MSEITASPAVKKCGWCQETKPIDAFQKNAARKDRLQSQCRDCRNPYSRPTRGERPPLPTPEEKRARELENRAHRRAKEAAARADRRAYWAVNDPRENPSPKWCPRCSQHRARTSFSTNPSNSDGLANACYTCDANARSERRAKLRGVWVEYVDRAVLWARDQGICYLCSLPAGPEQWDLDHVDPIVNGGEHSYFNTAVTHPSCNRSKNGTPWPDVSWPEGDAYPANRAA